MDILLIRVLLNHNRINYDEVPDYACKIIQGGIDNTDIFELAAMNKPVDRFECERLINKIISDDYNEMNVKTEEAKILCLAILRKEIDAIFGALIIGDISESYSRNEDLWKFKVYAESYYDLVSSYESNSLSKSDYSFEERKQIIENKILKHAKQIISKQ